MTAYISRILVVQGGKNQNLDLLSEYISEKNFIIETIPLEEVASIYRKETPDHYDMVIFDLRGQSPVCPPTVFLFRKKQSNTDALMLIGEKDTSLIELLQQDLPGAAPLVYLIEPVDPLELHVLIDHLTAQRRVRLFSDESTRLAEQLSVYNIIRTGEIANNLLEEGTLQKIVTETCKTAMQMFNVDHSACVQFEWNEGTGKVNDYAVVFAEDPPLPSGPMVGERILIKGVPVEDSLLSTKQPIEIKNIASDAGFESIRDLPLKHRISSMLLVPVVVGDRVVASFSLDVIENLRSFSQEEVNLCQKLAGQVALAISKIEKEHEAEEIRRSWKAAQKVTEIAAHGNFDETMNCIVRTFVEDLGAEISTLYIYDSASDKFVRRYVHGCELSSTAEPSEIPDGGALRRILELGGKPYHYTEDAQNDEIFRGTFVTKEDVRTAFGMRLSYANDQVGVFFANYRSPRKVHLKWYQLNAFISFGHQAAVSIKTALLSDQSNRLKMMLDSLYAAGQALPEGENTSGALQRITDAALKAVMPPGKGGTMVSYIAMVQRDSNVVRIEAASPPIYLEKLKEKVKDIELNQNNPRGILSQAIANGKTEVVPDVKDSPSYIEVFPDVKAQISVPLKVGETVIGALTIEKANSPALTQEERENLEHLAGHATSIIQASRQLVILADLLRVGSNLEVSGDGKDINRLLSEIANIVKGSFWCDTVMICSYDEQRKEITLPVVLAGKRKTPSSFMRQLEKMPNQRFPIHELSNESSIRRIIQGTEDHVFAPDARKHKVFKDSSTVLDEKYQSCIGIRLTIPREGASRVVGIMFLNFRLPHKFDEQERREIRLFAQYTAYALYTVQINKQLAYMEDQNWIVSNQLQWKKQFSDYIDGIKTTTQLIGEELKNQSLPKELEDRVAQRLEAISGYASDMSLNTQPPGSSMQSGKKPANVVSLVKDRLKVIWEREWDNLTYVEIPYIFNEPTSKPIYTVEVNQEWLSYAIDLIVDIAVDRIGKDVSRGELEISIASHQDSSDLNKERIEIILKDSESTSLHKKIGPLYLDQNIQWRVARSILIAYGGELFYNRGKNLVGNIYTLSLPIFNEADETDQYLEGSGRNVKQRA